MAKMPRMARMPGVKMPPKPVAIAEAPKRSMPQAKEPLRTSGGRDIISITTRMRETPLTRKR